MPNLNLQNWKKLPHDQQVPYIKSVWNDYHIYDTRQRKEIMRQMGDTIGKLDSNFWITVLKKNSEDFLLYKEVIKHFHSNQNIRQVDMKMRFENIEKYIAIKLNLELLYSAYKPPKLLFNVIIDKYLSKYKDDLDKANLLDEQFQMKIDHSNMPKPVVPLNKILEIAYKNNLLILRKNVYLLSQMVKPTQIITQFEFDCGVSATP